MFSRKKSKGKRKEQYAFVFICKGPDPGGLRDIIHGFAMTSNGIYEALVQNGFEGSGNNIFMYGPDWNETVYSSHKVQEPGEADDLMGKIKKKMSDRGFSYAGENVRAFRYDPSTNYGQMGFFMTYLFIEK